MLNSFERSLKKGSVFSVGIKNWKGDCFNCKEALGKSNMSASMHLIMMKKPVVVWLECLACGQQHEIIGLTILGRVHV